MFFLVKNSWKDNHASGSQDTIENNNSNNGSSYSSLRAPATKIYVSIDETNAVITYEISPSTTLPEVSVSDETILKVENFKIVPIKVGTTTVVLTHPTAPDLKCSIEVVIFKPTINFSFDKTSFVSGDNSVYTLTISTNFVIANKTLDLSNNMEIISNELGSENIILKFKLSCGESFKITATLNGTTLEKVYSCSEHSPSDPADDPIEDPSDPADPVDSDDDDTEIPPSDNPKETYSYEIIIDENKISDITNVNLDPSKTMYVYFSVLNNSGEEKDFSSDITFVDANEITKINGVSTFKIFSGFVKFKVFSGGTITITFTSTIYNLSRTITLNFN